ncbi:MAG TPA: DUF4349 domain-containing protein [Vicinamibacterales bacterium]|nr:DUF4349 domain-containing protein [Vicinamibacterales bacterium]
MGVAEHGHAPEDVMAYVDGELSSERAAAVEAHLAECVSCRELMEGLRQVSAKMAAWSVEPAPLTLRAASVSAEPRALWRVLLPPRVAAWQLALAPVVLVLAGLWIREGLTIRSAVEGVGEREPVGAGSPLYSPPAGDFGFGGWYGQRGAGQQGQGGAQGQQGQGTPGAGAATEPREQRPASKPQIARTATLRIMATDFDSVRPAVERIVADAGGFVGRLDVSGERGDMRALRATVRVPSDRLEQVLTALRQLGKVQAESQGADDVTEQVVDLNARLTNARNTERRLTQVLEQRTGKVGDVLQVEREIARVREEIERMDAERTTLERRVTYATVALDIGEPRKAALDLGPITVPDRLRNAAVEGLQWASQSALGAAIVALRVLPSLLIWGAIGAWPAVVVVRRVRSLRGPSVA